MIFKSSEGNSKNVMMSGLWLCESCVNSNKSTQHRTALCVVSYNVNPDSIVVSVTLAEENVCVPTPLLCDPCVNPWMPGEAIIPPPHTHTLSSTVCVCNSLERDGEVIPGGKGGNAKRKSLVPQLFARFNSSPLSLDWLGYILSPSHHTVTHAMHSPHAVCFVVIKETAHFMDLL